MYGGKIQRDYGESAPEAWANVIGAMKDFELAGGLKQLLNAGSGSPPTLPQFVKACRNAKEHDGPEANHSPERTLPRPEFMEKFHAHGQKCLFAYLWKRGPASAESLQSMLVKKNNLVCDYRSIAEEEEVTGKELKEALFKAWDEVYESAPIIEFNRHQESFIRTGFASSAI